jgi:flagellar biosynthesis GTPase FlhF
MKLVGVISTAVLSLTLGVAIPAYTQDKQEEEKAKPAQEEKKAKPAKQDQKNAQQQDKNNKQEEKSAQQQDKNNKQEEKSAQQQDKNNQQEQKNAQQQDRNNKQEEKNAQQQHSQPAQRAGGGSRIPDDRYRANFGREHSFHVSHADYDRDRRFQYGGYWFSFVDVWPSNWQYTQDVFVVEIDGMYYLCNPMYPGINVAIDVTL